MFPIREVLTELVNPVAVLKKRIITQLISRIEHQEYETGYAHDQANKADEGPAFLFEQTSDSDLDIVVKHVMDYDAEETQKVDRTPGHAELKRGSLII
jgi:hypothetical protein